MNGGGAFFKRIDIRLEISLRSRNVHLGVISILVMPHAK